jgi:hypothetical protein
VNMYLILLVLIGLVGCGDPNPPHYYDLNGEETCDSGDPSCYLYGNNPAPTLGSPGQDPWLLPYVQIYTTNAKIAGVTTNAAKVKVTLGSTSDRGFGILAYCQIKRSGPEIVVDRNAWLQADETKRNLIIHHEMGHCDRGLAHDTTIIKPGDYPASIMNPKVINSNLFIANANYYLKEFFSAPVNQVGGPTLSLADCNLHDD